MPKLDPVNGGNAVNVTYQVTEGQSFTIGQVHIEGNTKTKDRVIRRELAVLPGEPFDTVAIEASRRRLINLNYFNTVDIMPVDTSYLNEKDLVISVSEKPTGTINFGAGFSSIDDLVGFVEVSQTNFDIGNWPSLTGGGQRFRTSARVGTSRKDFSIALTEPWFLGRRIALTGEGFYRELLFLSDFYDQTEYGGAVSLRKSLGEFASATLQYKPEQVEIDVDNNASAELLAEDGTFFSSVIGLDLIHDTRDNLYLPREGHRVVAGADTGVGGDVGATTFAVSASQHFNGPWDTILSLNGRYANVSSADQIFTRQFLGGANNLRGFDYRDVGPKDENGEPLGGDQAWNATAELTFPIVEKVRPAVFYDIGEVSGGPGRFGGGVNSNYGFGVRLFILGGAPVRLDYGIPIDSDVFNDSSGRFNFTMGYQF
jgi:outer membrane protein insertion porin family